ncbi:MAG: M55 family metallopeptidase, partial [Lachnospiraceae bacterium]|nr:M55 family metallopeptidase [Lachnospiraceae bacterium]
EDRKMNILVMVDIEGISGIYTREQVLPGECRFQEGRAYMTADVNACTAGLKAAGVDKIYVYDCHGTSYSLIWDKLSDDADYYICGSTDGRRMPGIEDCDGVILLGYHSMAGTAGGVLEHSWSSVNVQNVLISGKQVGELAMDAAVAGEYKKPVIMVSGDDRACAEAKAILPNVVCAEVKKGLNNYGAMLMPPKTAHDLIYNKSVEAVENMKNCAPFAFAKPISCTVEVTERTVLANAHKVPYAKRLDGRTYEVECDSVEQLIYRLMCF